MWDQAPGPTLTSLPGRCWGLSVRQEPGWACRGGDGFREGPGTSPKNMESHAGDTQLLGQHGWQRDNLADS